MQRLKRYFTEFDKADWEVLRYFIIIILMLLIIPAALFTDYLRSPEFWFRSWYWQKTLTESLRNWWVWVLDNWRGLW